MLNRRKFLATAVAVPIAAMLPANEPWRVQTPTGSLCRWRMLRYRTPRQWPSPYGVGVENFLTQARGYRMMQQLVQQATRDGFVQTMHDEWIRDDQHR